MNVTWQWGILLPLAIAVATDLRSNKIYNWLTLPTFGLGALLALFTGGLHGLQLSLLGAAMGFLPCFLLMVLSPAMKAGDVKLLTATGAWLGSPLMPESLLYGMVAWGVLALMAMALRGNALPVMKNLYRFFVTLPVGGFSMANRAMVLSRAHYLPLGVGIALGSALALAFPHLR